MRIRAIGRAIRADGSPVRATLHQPDAQQRREIHCDCKVPEHYGATGCGARPPRTNGTHFLHLLEQVVVRRIFEEGARRLAHDLLELVLGEAELLDDVLAVLGQLVLGIQRLLELR